jgi:hypothetical protein
MPLIAFLVNPLYTTHQNKHGFRPLARRHVHYHAIHWPPCWRARRSRGADNADHEARAQPRNTPVPRGFRWGSSNRYNLSTSRTVQKKWAASLETVAGLLYPFATIFGNHDDQPYVVPRLLVRGEHTPNGISGIIRDQGGVFWLQSP